MTKIKNFRIHLRSREIARWLKSEYQTTITPELEATIEGAIARYKGKIHPAAIYTTMTRATAEKATPLAFPDKAVAVSLVAANIGEELGAALQEVPEAAQDEHQLLRALQHEAIQQSVQFAVRLLSDQAKDEDCDMSVPIVAEDPVVTESLAGLLGCRRIGLEIGAQAPLPPHARLSWIFWTPQRKHASRRNAEKVAA